MVVLDEVDWMIVGFFEGVLVVVFEEEFVIVVEYLGFEEDDVGDCQVGCFYQYMVLVSRCLRYWLQLFLVSGVVSFFSCVVLIYFCWQVIFFGQVILRFWWFFRVVMNWLVLSSELWVLVFSQVQLWFMIFMLSWLCFRQVWLMLVIFSLLCGEGFRFLVMFIICWLQKYRLVIVQFDFGFSGFFFRLMVLLFWLNLIMLQCFGFSMWQVKILVLVWCCEVLLSNLWKLWL